MNKLLYNQITNQIGHDYKENYQLIKYVLEKYDRSSFSEEEYENLYGIFLSCDQLDFFKKELGLDISEVDVKKYTLDMNYRGKLFQLNTLKEKFSEAEKGNAHAALFLAKAFHENYFSPALSKYTAKWCEKAAEAGSADAMMAMGSFYRWGDGGVFVDIQKALYWYGKAAELGEADAISFMESFGDGESNDFLELSAISGADGVAVKWYKSEYMIKKWYEEAESGNAEVQYELGRQLTPGTNCGAFRRSVKESIKYYEMAANQGMVDAMFNLANAYRYGWSDLPPDLEKEFYWRKRAADAGDMEASYLVGEMYIEGNGTYEDFAEGLKYLAAAADSQDAGEEVRNYYEMVCKIEKIFQENKEKVIPINSDFYPQLGADDRLHLQEYLNRIMYDMICGIKDGNGKYALATYNHVVTLIEFAVRQCQPIVQMIYEEHSEKEFDLLATRFLYHYLDSIEGEEGFYEEKTI